MFNDQDIDCAKLIKTTIEALSLTRWDHVDYESLGEEVAQIFWDLENQIVNPPLGALIDYRLGLIFNKYFGDNISISLDYNKFFMTSNVTFKIVYKKRQCVS